MQNSPIEEEQGAEGLVLGGGGDMLVDGQVGQESLNFRAAHLFGVAFVMEEDVTFDPVEISGFGMERVMFEPEGFADLIE